MTDKKKEAPAASRADEDKPRLSAGPASAYWDDITCPRCVNKGRLRWEEGPSDASKELIGIEGNFYERLTKKSWQIELVCNVCGAVLPRRSGK
jgi:hypothetical protein